MPTHGDGLPALNADRGLEVTVEEVRRFVDAGALPTGARLIDCREEDEFAICRIPCAELVPLSSFGERDFSVFLESDHQVVIYCHHGMRSAQAADYLRAKGFPLVFSMRGGIDLWSVEVDPEVARY